jgi:hypothetical protein
MIFCRIIEKMVNPPLLKISKWKKNLEIAGVQPKTPMSNDV